MTEPNGVPEDCPLCFNTDVVEIDSRSRHPGAQYMYCNKCDLIYITSPGILSPEEERARYLTHENTLDNRGYVDLLTRFLDKAVSPFASGGRALEFGCGPGPVLGELLRRRGFEVDLYDPYFSPGLQRPKRGYDLLTSTEVVEHVVDAAGLWDTFDSLVREEGYLALTTRFHPGPRDFGDWWYHRDPTHVRFYSRDTLKWIAENHPWELVLLDERDTATLKRISRGT